MSLSQSWLGKLAKRSNTLYELNERRKNARRKAFVTSMLPVGGVGAELGVHKGFFTRSLLAHARPTTLHLVDPWYLLGPEWPWTGGTKCTVAGAIGVLRMFRQEIRRGQVAVHISGDLEVLAGFPDAHFDWVYVDSSHDYAHTVQELELLKAKVKPTGTIAGDDWQTDPTHRHHGVCRAVREFLASEPYELVYASDDDKQWAIRRRDAGGVARAA